MTRSFVDQMGRAVSIAHPPKRIISLVPSQTELLCYLGLKSRLVGVTKFCVHPEDIRRKCTVVGGTKKLRSDKIDLLQPDLIIGNKEENAQQQIESLMKRWPVWISDVANLDQALDMIARIGELTGSEKEAIQLGSNIKRAFHSLSENPPLPLKTAYLIWRKPYMVAGSNTFIHDMLTRMGLTNTFASQPRYPQLTPEQLQRGAPDVLLLSSEPYPFGEKNIDELREICPDAAVILVDGELFSWYGNRLLHAAPYFAKLRGEIFGSDS